MPFLRDKSEIYMRRSQKLTKLSERNGLRHAIYNKYQDKYVGEWKAGIKSGKGLMLTRYRQMYEGDFDRNYREGFGVLSYEQPNRVFALEYRGEWKGGKMHGFGLRRYRDGTVYLGWWNNGKRHGHGQFWYLDGCFYDGNWMKDKRHGLGLFARHDGNRYEGEWADDMRHGKGRYYHLNTGQMQEGVWYQHSCIYSTMIDIPYRQTVKHPTPYPIRTVELLELAEVCNLRELKALSHDLESCLSFSLPSLAPTLVTK